MADGGPAVVRPNAQSSPLPPVVRRWTAIHVSDVALPVSIALWAVGVSQTHTTSLGPLGLPAALPAVFYAGVVLLVLSALIELSIESSSAWRMGVHVAGLVVMLYGTGALVYPEGRYSWLYKSIGVVQYVNAHGQLNPAIDIYQNWPGFFALAAWFDKVAGVSSPLDYAKWAQVVFELAAVPLLYLIYDGLSLTYRQRWTALLLYPAANWIGQDYLSPQALGTLLSLGIMALAMRYLFTGNQTQARRRRRWIRRPWRGLKRGRAAEPGQPGTPAVIPAAGPPGTDQGASSAMGGLRIAGIRQRLTHVPQTVWVRLHALREPGRAGWLPSKKAAPPEGRLAPARRRRALLVTILLMFFVLTSVHELSPYIVALQLIVLAAARPLRPRWVPLAMLAIAIAYLLPRFAFVNSHYGLLGSFGSFFGNAAPPSSSSSAYAGSIPASQLLIQHCADALSVLVWLLALVGVWRLRHSGRIVLALIVLTFSPVLILFGQAYGNEGLLRVYLFSLPWAAALAAAAVEPGPLARIRLPRRRATLTAVLTRLASAPRAAHRGLHTAPGAIAAIAVRLGRAARATPLRLSKAAAAAAKPRALFEATLRHLRKGFIAAALGTAARKTSSRFRAVTTNPIVSWIAAVVRWVRAPVALCAVIAMFLVAFYGDDAFDAFPATEVNTIYSFLQHARPGALYLAEDNIPADDTAQYYLFPNAVIFGARSGAPLANTATANVATLIADNSGIYTDGGKEPAYVLITPSMVPYNNAYKQAPPDSFAILEKSLASSRQWKLVVSNDGTIIYELPAYAGS